MSDTRLLKLNRTKLILDKISFFKLNKNGIEIKNLIPHIRNSSRFDDWQLMQTTGLDRDAGLLVNNNL